jgi:hypothetical protein
MYVHVVELRGSERLASSCGQYCLEVCNFFLALRHTISSPHYGDNTRSDICHVFDANVSKTCNFHHANFKKIKH